MIWNFLTETAMRINRMKHKGLLLLLATLAVIVLMSQRPSRRYPSPADPGMDLSAPPKKKGTGGPESPNHEDVPTTDDPNAGDTPEIDDEQNETPDVEDDKPHLPPPPQDKSLKIKRFEVSRIASGSAFGEAGDWVFVVYGDGFIAGEEPPVLHLGDSILLEDVFVNSSGTELYALLPADQEPTLSARGFQQLAIQNPGGYNRNPSRWARIAVNKPQLVQSLQTAPQTTFRLGPYFMEQVKYTEQAK
jgi:hypothetical protein